MFYPLAQHSVFVSFLKERSCCFFLLTEVFFKCKEGIGRLSEMKDEKSILVLERYSFSFLGPGVQQKILKKKMWERYFIERD